MGGHRALECADKRKGSPSPLMCYECNGKGYLVRESEASATAVGSAALAAAPPAPNPTTLVQGGGVTGYSPRQRHDRQRANNQDDRRSPLRDDRSYGQDKGHVRGARQADHGSDRYATREKDRDRAMYYNRDNSNPLSRGFSVSPIRKYEGPVTLTTPGH